METVRLSLPATTDDLAGLTAGTVVYLSGRIFTSREGVYKRAIEEGHGMPAPTADLGTANFHCSPAASINDDGTYKVRSVTATASFRFATWIDRWLEMSGCNIIIGKGGMTKAIYQDTFVPRNAIYLTTVGYGTGALLARGIKQCVDVHWLDELGIAQAAWVLEVENFGPLLVEGDLKGESLFDQVNNKIAPGISKLYEDTRAATLRRYGETDDKSEELI